MPVHDIAFALFFYLAASKDMDAFDYFRKAWDTGVTGVYKKPFYTKWKGRLKSWEEENRLKVSLAFPCTGGLLQQQYAVLKEHWPSQAELIEDTTLF